MFSTLYIVMKEVKYQWKNLLMEEIQLKLRGALLLLTEDGFQLHSKKKSQDLKNWTLENFLKSEIFLEPDKISIIIQFQIIQIIYMDFNSIITFCVHLHKIMKAMLLFELKKLKQLIVMVCITSKNLISSNHNVDTNMLLIYLYCNYHMLRLLHLD